MATKEAELRKTIEEQSGEIADLRKSNHRMKEEILARVSCRYPSDQRELMSRNPLHRTVPRP